MYPGRPVVTFRLTVVSYFVSNPIWLYRLGERQTGHEAVLRTLTCHLPTNLPPPLHSVVIYVMSSACEIGIARVELMLAESWMADKRVGVGNPRPSLSCATAPYITGFNKRAASRIRHRLGSSQEYQSLSSSAIFLRLLDRMPVRFSVVISLRPSSRLDNGSEVALRDVTDVTANAVLPSGRVLVCRMERNPISAPRCLKR